MKTTSPSTATTDRLVLELLPLEHVALIRRACNALSKRQQTARLNGQVRPQQVSDGINRAIELHRRQLEVLPHRDRTSFLMARLQASPVKYGLKQTPDRETVKPLIDAAFKIDADSES